MRTTGPGCGISWRVTVRCWPGSGPRSFAGLGFAVAKFGRTAGLIQFAGYLGIIMTLVGLLFTIIGYAQHRAILTREHPPPGAPVLPRWPAVVAAASCALAGALLAAYLAVSAT